MGFQEEKGIMVKRPVWEASCVVIAEHWPSWTFALHSIGVRELKTVLPVAAERKGDVGDECGRHSLLGERKGSH